MKILSEHFLSQPFSRLSLWVRMLVVAPALLSLLWGQLDFEALAATLLAVEVALLVGDTLGRSSYRSVLLVGGSVLGFLLVQQASFWSGASTLFPELLSPNRFLLLRAVLTSALSGFFIMVLLRSMGHRYMLMGALEIIIYAGACATVFLPHREKNIMRPFWLSDWAWTWGLDPSLVLSLLGLCLCLFLLSLSLLSNLNEKKNGVLQMRLRPSERKSNRVEPASRRWRRFAQPVLRVGAPLLLLFALLAVLVLSRDLVFLNELLPMSGADDLAKEFGSGGKGNGEQKSGMSSGKGENQEERKNPTGGGQVQPAALVIMESDYEPPTGYFYFRQESFSELVGTRLQPTLLPIIPYDGIRGFPAQQVENEEQAPSWFRTSVKTKTHLLTQHTAAFAVESLISYSPLQNPRPGTFVRSYESESLALELSYAEMLNFGAGHPLWTAEQRAHYLEVPNDPRYQQLAEEIVADLPDDLVMKDFAQAAAVKIYLDERMKYTRAVKHGGKDPTASFLFGPENQMIGYCVNSAHAAVFLWRSLGFASRVSVGYAVPAENRQGPGILITRAEAHAWPEIFLDGLGWVPLDIAPAENLEQNEGQFQPDLLSSLMDLAESSEDGRYRDAIDFAALWAKWVPIVLDWLQKLLLTALLAAYGYKLLRRLRPRWQADPRSCYLSALDALSDVGWRRNYGEDLTAFSARVALLTVSFTHLSAAHQRYFFSGRSAEAAQLRGQLKMLEQELAAAVPFWRRLCGALNPFSSFLSR